MISFAEFIAESTVKPTEMPDSSVIYSHKVGEHTIHTAFYPREQGGKTSGYDVHFFRHSPGGGNSSSRRGMSGMTSRDRVSALTSVMKSVKHFISTKKPEKLYAEPNTKKKSDSFERVLHHVAKSSNGSVSRVGPNSVLSLSH